MALIYSLLAALIVSLLSFVGLLTFALKDKVLNNVLIYLVSFSVGGLMGGAFFHLLPEAIVDSDSPLSVFVYTTVGFIIFFVLEKFLRWHHCHNEKCEEKSHMGYLNLVGDTVHNFLDGMIIVSAFSVNFNLGLIVTLSIIIHEIPQELGDFGVLLYSGFKKSKALLFNFLSAIFALLGVLAGYFLITWVNGLVVFLVPAAAGSFIYIAASDLVPEIHKHSKTKTSVLTFTFFLLALIIMYTLKVVLE